MVLIYLRAPEFHLDTAFKICFKLSSETHREDKTSLRKYYKKSRGSFFFLSRGENPWFLSHKGHHKAGNTVFEYKLSRDCLHKPCLGSQVASLRLKVAQYKNASLYSVRKERLVLIVLHWKRRLSSAATG